LGGGLEPRWTTCVTAAKHRSVRKRGARRLQLGNLGQVRANNDGAERGRPFPLRLPRNRG
jgi:hypothetical protein